MSRPYEPTAQQQQIRFLYRILSHRLFRQMLRRQGIDLAESWWRGFDAMIFGALRRCAACSGRDACRAWLAEPHPTETCPSFCPNAEVIAACRILDPRAAPPRAEEIEVAGRREPPLAEVLGDPIIRQMIDADGSAGAGDPREPNRR